jgi:DNA-binding beta-propeller fold protein YncE
METIMCKALYVLLVVSPMMTTAMGAQRQPPTPTEAGATSYKVRQIFHVGGTGGWDYLTVDPDRRLLYVPRTTHTMVVNETNGKLVADIPGQKRNHGVAIVTEVGRGFISDGEDGSVVIFDLKTYQVLGKVKAAKDADAIIYDPVSRKILVACGDAGVLVSISPDVDPKAGKADVAVDLGGKPEFLAAADGKAYVNLVNTDQVAVVDTKTMRVIRKWPTAPGGVPVAMAMDAAHHRLFVGCRKPQKLIVMSSDNGSVLADLPVGAGVDAAQFDGDIFASCRDGTLAVARETSPGTFAIIQTVETRPGAKTMCLDPKTHALYLPTAEFSRQRDVRSRPMPKAGSFMILVVEASP